MDQIQGSSSWDVVKGFVRQQFEDLASQISAGWNTNHNADGTHNFAKINAAKLLFKQGTAINVPTGLGVADIGTVFYVTDYGHIVIWTGMAWEFAPGDVGNGFFRDYAIAPQEVGWYLCNGGTTTYLVVGTTLSTMSFTTPNLTGSPAYRKAAAAYTGTINAGSGSTGAGSMTGTGTTGTGTTGTGTSGSESADITSVTLTGGGTNTITPPHTHSIPGLSIPGLSIPALSIPSLNLTSVDVTNLGVLPYFRM